MPAPKTPPQRSWGRSLLRGTALTMGAIVGILVFSIALRVAVYSVMMNRSPLGLYEYVWQATQDRIFDPQQLKDWPSYETRFNRQIKTDDDAVKYANQMLQTLDDPYTRLLSPAQVQAEMNEQTGNYAGVGLQFSTKFDDQGNVVRDKDGHTFIPSTTDGYPIVDTAFEGAPAYNAGVRDGDAIISVNGTSLQNLDSGHVVSLLRGASGTTANLVVRRGSQQLNITVVRGEVHMPSVHFKQIDPDIAYIRLDNFIEDHTVAEMEGALAQAGYSTKALILDLRDNPGGMVNKVLELVPLFVDQGKIVTIKERIPGGGYETKTYTARAKQHDVWVEDSTDSGSSSSWSMGGRTPDMADGKLIIILVNGDTASAAEMFTGALKDDGRAEVVGTTSFGKGIGQTVIPAPDGTELHVTSLRYYTPSGNWLGDGNHNRHGIQPTYTVEAPKGYHRGSADDAQLAFAIRQLHAELAANGQ